MNYKSFETERLILRPTQTEDALFILELLNSPKWIKYIGDRNLKTIDDAKSYIETKMIYQLKRLGFANYTVLLKSNNTKIGTCGLYDREDFEDIDIGFAFLPKYEKKGYAYEAASKIKDAAISEFGINCITAMTTKDNYSSQKLIEKLGLKLSGTTKFPDENEELLVYKFKNVTL